MQYQHLANFKSKEGYWHDRNIFREVIKDILNITEAKNMLEIGFNIGYSASMWLEFDVNKALKVTSVDIGKHEDTEAAARAVKGLHGDRFEFILCDSKKVKPQLLNKYFDLAFVDGDHGHEGVISDVNLCLDLNIPYLVFDDWHHKEEDQNAVRETAEEIYKNKLTRLKLYDLEGMKVKVALYRNDTVNTKENFFKRQVSKISPSG